MFNWRKNKKENKLSNSDAQTPVKKSDDVTFHTMQDDLDASRKKIMIGEQEKDGIRRTKKKSGSEIHYDNQEQEEEAKKDASLNSPFLNNLSPAPKPFTAPPKAVKTDESTDDKKSAAAVGQKPAIPKRGRGMILKIITFLLAMAAISLGAYFFWISSNQIETPQTPAAPETQVPVEESAPVEKYSSKNPNYLSIDTESASAEDIAQLLIQMASEITGFKSDGPFEFIVTDANNNPLSFPIFAYLFEINLSQNVLDGFDESFSLYFYRDGDNVRTGLAIDINNKETTILEIAKEENTLPEKLQPLFLGNSFSETGRSFNTSQYKDFQIRYINLNEDNTLSVDYSIIENQLIIGTSKNTIRAIIDRIEHLENSTAEDESTDTDVDIEL